jgi:hypothetical protein
VLLDGQPIQSRGAWKGPALADASQWTYRLSTAEANEIHAATRAARASGK